MRTLLDLLREIAADLVAAPKMHYDSAMVVDKRTGNNVIGTVERPAWHEGMRQPKLLDEMLKYIADFKEELSFTVRPAGWYPADER